jgi:hypothetical protein
MTAPRIAMTTLRTAVQCHGRAAPSTSGASVAVIPANVELMTVQAREGEWVLGVLVVWLHESVLQQS